VTQLVTIRVVTFVLLAACGALCQQPPAADLLQQLQSDSNAPDLQRQEILTSSSLPDAPSSVQPPTQAERFPTVVTVVRSPLTLDAPGVTVINAGVMRETGPGHVTPGLRPSFIPRYETAFTQEDSSTFLD
jgi:hypothetical protein